MCSRQHAYQLWLCLVRDSNACVGLHGIEMLSLMYIDHAAFMKRHETKECLGWLSFQQVCRSNGDGFV